MCRHLDCSVASARLELSAADTQRMPFMRPSPQFSSVVLKLLYHKMYSVDDMSAKLNITAQKRACPCKCQCCIGDAQLNIGRRHHVVCASKDVEDQGGCSSY